MIKLAWAILLLSSHNAFAAWAHKGNSAVVSDLDNGGAAAITITLPTHASGDILLAPIAGYPGVECPGGWTELENRASVTILCGKIDNGAESNPTFSAAADNDSTIIGCVSSFSGGELTIHVSTNTHTASSQDIDVGALTISQASTLVVAVGAGYLRLGTGSVVANGISAFTESCDGQVADAGFGIPFNLAAAWSIQTTATNIASSTPGFDLAAGAANEGFSVIAALTAAAVTSATKARRRKM